LLIRRPNQYQRAIGAGNRAAHQDKVLRAVDLDNIQIADGHALRAIPSGHALALFRPAAAPIASQGADAAWGAVMFLHAVAGGQAGKTVTFHDARSAAPFGGANHVHTGNVLEYTVGSENLADFDLGGFLQSELANVP